MAAIVVELAALLGVDQQAVKVLGVASSNPHKFIVALPDDTQAFAKLCSSDELERTLAAIDQAPGQTLPILSTFETAASHPGHHFVLWPKMVMDGYDAVTCEPDFDTGLMRLKHCLQVLADFHDQGLLHGDCKLENFVFDEEARPWLIDFECLGGWSGLAPRTCLGTPAFAAPECWPTRCPHLDCQRWGLTQAADVFSLVASFLLKYSIGTPAYAAKQGRGVRDEQGRLVPNACPASCFDIMTDELFAVKGLLPEREACLSQLVLHCCSPDVDVRLSAAEAAALLA